MTEIKIGEYVRTKKGQIDKVKEICKHEAFIKKIYRFYNMRMLEDEEIEKTIVNHSKNIIELIEIGDYINGSKLISIDYAEDEFGNCDKLHFYYHFEDDEKDVNEYYDKLIIKSIVTKEQFEGIEYRLED